MSADLSHIALTLHSSSPSTKEEKVYEFILQLSQLLEKEGRNRRKEHHLPASVLYTPWCENTSLWIRKKRPLGRNSKASKAFIIFLLLQFHAFILFHDCFQSKPVLFKISCTQGSCETTPCQPSGCYQSHFAELF